MKLFHCQCGNRIFFANTVCMACNRQLGFDPASLQLLSLDTNHQGLLIAADGTAYRRCSHSQLHGNCNWLLRADEAEGLCFSCRMTEVIPALDRPGNLKLWTRMEEAKRRLLYSLLSFRLPLTGEHALKFRFMEDQGRNPDVYESYVVTGHFDSTITINVAEADDVARQAVREQMHERYRTVLGHLRHESAHFYFAMLTSQPGLLEECRSLFGDERSDYMAALQTYYDQGPPANWPENYVSAYASAHPAEDFAETFAHFLHITDALESARSGQLAPAPGDVTFDDWIESWIDLAITLNEISRSLGSDDPYPFLLPEPVKLKLGFIGRLLRLQAERQAC